MTIGIFTNESFVVLGCICESGRGYRHNDVIFADISDNQQFNALAAEFGEAAATRLMEVKYQQHTWQLKVAEYKEKLSELNQLYADSPEALETQVTELRETLFDANEQKRLRVALKQG